MSFKKLALTLISLVFSTTLLAQSAIDSILQPEQEFLPVDQAFEFDFQQQDDKLTLSWQIAEGYYLYKKQFKTVVKEATLGEPTFPTGVEIEDEFFGVSEVFYQQVSIDYPIIESVTDGVVKVRYQGCADAGLCYPPTTKVVYLQEVSAASEQAASAAPVSQQFELRDLLSSENALWLTLLIFLGLGVGLAFTPCVFPMYPILSGIIIGQGKSIRFGKALGLSFVYVQGMAITYSLLGLAVASAGVQFQAALQHPAILITLIVVFVLLALVMFGTWELQLPSSWQEKLNAFSNQQKGGTLFGVFVMGAISGLVASPCTTAPLTGILLFIAQSGDALLGFSALYFLSLGMGIPLMLFAVTGGKLLPKAGAWMNVVKATFGFMLLAVALLFIERMVTHIWTELAWAALGLSAFSYLWVVNQNTALTFYKGVRTLLLFVGLFASAQYGYQHLRPAQKTVMPTQAVSQTEAGTEAHQSSFMRVKDLGDFEQKLAAANAQGKSVMVDLYADWCVACKEFEKYTFHDPLVQEALANTVLMQIDLTDNTPTNLAFQDEFAVLGLPTILFFDKQGNELDSARVTGFMSAEPFADHVNKALNP